MQGSSSRSPYEAFPQTDDGLMHSVMSTRSSSSEDSTASSRSAASKKPTDITDMTASVGASSSNAESDDDQTTPRPFVSQMNAGEEDTYTDDSTNWRKRRPTSLRISADNNAPKGTRSSTGKPSAVVDSPQSVVAVDDEPHSAVPAHLSHGQIEKLLKQRKQEREGKEALEDHVDVMEGQVYRIHQMLLEELDRNVPYVMRMKMAQLSEVAKKGLVEYLTQHDQAQVEVPVTDGWIAEHMQAVIYKVIQENMTALRMELSELISALENDGSSSAGSSPRAGRPRGMAMSRRMSEGSLSDEYSPPPQAPALDKKALEKIKFDIRHQVMVEADEHLEHYKKEIRDELQAERESLERQRKELKSQLEAVQQATPPELSLDLPPALPDPAKTPQGLYSLKKKHSESASDELLEEQPETRGHSTQFKSRSRRKPAKKPDYSDESDYDDDSDYQDEDEDDDEDEEEEEDIKPRSFKGRGFAQSAREARYAFRSRPAEPSPKQEKGVFDLLDDTILSVEDFTPLPDSAFGPEDTFYPMHRARNGMCPIKVVKEPPIVPAETPIPETPVPGTTVSKTPSLENLSSAEDNTNIVEEHESSSESQLPSDTGEDEDDEGAPLSVSVERVHSGRHFSFFRILKTITLGMLYPLVWLWAALVGGIFLLCQGLVAYYSWWYTVILAIRYLFMALGAVLLNGIISHIRKTFVCYWSWLKVIVIAIRSPFESTRKALATAMSSVKNDVISYRSWWYTIICSAAHLWLLQMEIANSREQALWLAANSTTRDYVIEQARGGIGARWALPVMDLGLTFSMKDLTTMLMAVMVFAAQTADLWLGHVCALRDGPLKEWASTNKTVS